MAATINTGGGPSPAPNSSALNVTAVGVIKTGKGSLGTIIPFASGTLVINDCATSGTVATANQIYNAAVVAGTPVPCGNFPFFVGLYISVIPGQLALSFS